MTEAEALEELSSKLDARWAALALNALGSGGSPRNPAEAAYELAKVAPRWATEKGLTL